MRSNWGASPGCSGRAPLALSAIAVAEPVHAHVEQRPRSRGPRRGRSGRRRGRRRATSRPPRAASSAQVLSWEVKVPRDERWIIEGCCLWGVVCPTPSRGPSDGRLADDATRVMLTASIPAAVVAADPARRDCLGCRDSADHAPAHLADAAAASEEVALLVGRLRDAAPAIAVDVAADLGAAVTAADVEPVVATLPGCRRGGCEQGRRGGPGAVASGGCARRPDRVSRWRRPSMPISAPRGSPGTMRCGCDPAADPRRARCPWVPPCCGPVTTSRRRWQTATRRPSGRLPSTAGATRQAILEELLAPGVSDARPRPHACAPGRAGRPRSRARLPRPGPSAGWRHRTRPGDLVRGAGPATGSRSGATTTPGGGAWHRRGGHRVTHRRAMVPAFGEQVSGLPTGDHLVGGSLPDRCRSTGWRRPTPRPSTACVSCQWWACREGWCRTQDVALERALVADPTLAARGADRWLGPLETAATGGPELLRTARDLAAER